MHCKWIMISPILRYIESRSRAFRQEFILWNGIIDALDARIAIRTEGFIVFSFIARLTKETMVGYFIVVISIQNNRMECRSALRRWSSNFIVYNVSEVQLWQYTLNIIFLHNTILTYAWYAYKQGKLILTFPEVVTRKNGYNCMRLRLPFWFQSSNLSIKIKIICKSFSILFLLVHLTICHDMVTKIKNTITINFVIFFIKS